MGIPWCLMLVRAMVSLFMFSKSTSSLLKVLPNSLVTSASVSTICALMMLVIGDNMHYTSISLIALFSFSFPILCWTWTWTTFFKLKFKFEGSHGLKFIFQVHIQSSGSRIQVVYPDMQFEVWVQVQRFACIVMKNADLEVLWLKRIADSEWKY